MEQFIEKYPVAQPEGGGIMQSEVIKYQPPVEGVVVASGRGTADPEAGPDHEREQLWIRAIRMCACLADCLR